jgi:hypothetical protein
MQHMVSHSEPIQGSGKAIKSDHHTIHSIFAIPVALPRPTTITQQPSNLVLQPKERIEFRNLQIPEYRITYDELIEQHTEDLHSQIDEIALLTDTPQTKADQMFTLFTTTHLNLAEQALGKYTVRPPTNARRAPLGRTMENLRALKLTIPKDMLDERAAARKASKIAHAELQSNHRPADMQNITQCYRLACEATIAKAVQLQDTALATETEDMCFTQPGIRTRTSGNTGKSA